MYGQKYVVISQLAGAKDAVITFPTTVSHAEIVDKLGVKREEVVSAGYTVLNTDDQGTPVFHCYGESSSLGIAANGEHDSQLLNKKMYGTL